MKVFGITIGKKPKKGETPKANANDVGKSLQKLGATIARRQTSIIAIVVIVILSLTTLRMLQLIDPPVDEDKAAENLAQVKRVRIDEKAIDQIKALQDSQASANSNLNSGRTNPFNE